MQVEKFTFYGSFYEALMLLPEGERADFALGLLAYAFEGVEPGFEGPMAGMFALAKPNIDNSVNGVINGGKGGRPKGDKTQSEIPFKTPSKTGGKNPPRKPPSETKRKGKEGNSFPEERNYRFLNDSDGADARSAPPESVECPTCGVTMEPTNSFSSGKRKRIYRCPLCEDTAEVAVVA